jgi:hypothetical protein
MVRGNRKLLGCGEDYRQLAADVEPGGEKRCAAKHACKACRVLA